MLNAAFIESQAAYKIERFRLGDNVRDSFTENYLNTINKYRDWCNKMVFQFYYLKNLFDTGQMAGRAMTDLP